MCQGRFVGGAEHEDLDQFVEHTTRSAIRGLWQPSGWVLGISAANWSHGSSMTEDGRAGTSTSGEEKWRQTPLLLPELVPLFFVTNTHLPAEPLGRCVRIRCRRPGGSGRGVGGVVGHHRSPCVARTPRDLATVLVVRRALAATAGWVADVPWWYWPRRGVTGISEPVRHTIRRVLLRIDSDVLDAVLRARLTALTAPTPVGVGSLRRRQDLPRRPPGRWVRSRSALPGRPRVHMRREDKSATPRTIMRSPHSPSPPSADLACLRP